MSDNAPDSSNIAAYNSLLNQAGVSSLGNQNLVSLAAQGDLIGAVNWDIKFAYDALANQQKVYIWIPPQYRQNGMMSPQLGARLDAQNGGYNGIFFPVTPVIRQESKANWTAIPVTHSNYPFYSYANSDPGTISVQGKFPVQNNSEGLYWISTVHTLRALQKMNGASDPFPGAPPPVCKFYAHGNMLYQGVPVVVASFSVEYPEDVDYISVGSQSTWEAVRVPVLSTISVQLLPVYSRSQVNRFSVTGFVNASGKTSGLNGGGTGPDKGYI